MSIQILSKNFSLSFIVSERRQFDMAEMILPGTYIEVRAEKLIVPGPIAIGNIGIVGTARNKLCSSYG